MRIAARLRSLLAILLLALSSLWALPALAQVTLPGGQAAEPYVGATLSNPAGAITFFNPLDLPLGLTLNPADGSLTGTSLDYGTISFDVTFGAGTTVTYTITLTAPNLVLDATPLPAAMVGRPYSVTRGISGGSGSNPPFFGPFICVCVLTSVPLPPGGLFFPIFNIDHDDVTGLFSGTPDTPATITIEAHVIDGGIWNADLGMPFEGPAVNYTLVITPALAFGPSALAAGTEGVAYNQPIAPPTGGAGPFTFSAIGTLPAGITVDPATGAFAGTPAARSAGTYTVQVRAVDANGYDITAGPFTLAVGIPALALPSTNLPGGTILIGYDQTIAPATGGFAPYTYAVTGGALPNGVTMDATGRLTGSPSETGVFNFTVIATDSASRTAQQTYTLAVSMLPDPRTADLLDLLKWQHHAAGLMAGEQNDNIQQRLEQIHSGNTSSTGVVVVDQSGNAYLPKIQQAAGDAIDTALNTVLPENVGIWSAGRLTVGTIDQAPAIDFTTGSLTVGWDVRISEMLTLGLAGGFGSDRGVIGSSGTTGNAAGTYAAGYASLKPNDHAFVDGVLGAGMLGYDIQRFDPITGGFVTGHRDGGQVFGSLAAGADGEVGNIALSGYGRLEGSFARLGAYMETGGPGALAFAPQDVWAMAAVVGGKAGYSFHLEWGDVTPAIRVEYRHGAWGASDSSVNYAGLLNLPGFGLSGSLAAENAAIVGLQTAFDFDGGLALSVEYDARIGTSGTLSHTVKGVVGGSF